MTEKPTVAIVNTNTCNLLSVLYACKINQIECKVISENENPSKFDGIIFPGVGNFGFVTNLIFQKKLDRFVSYFLENEKPGLFICLGMQILFSSSEEENNSKGLNYLNGKVKKFDQIKLSEKIPIIGWNKINLKKNSNYMNGIKNLNFYFTHSYYCDPKDKSIIHSVVEKEKITYCSSVIHNKTFACQFHPEKSSAEGLKIYKNFKLEL